MTQRDVILSALRSAGSDGVCISDLGAIDWTCVLTARNRISELRASGVAIESERCTRHSHASTVSRYFLVERAPAAAVTISRATERVLVGQPIVGGAVSNSTPVQMAIAL